MKTPLEGRFDHFVAIDWSGAVGPRQRGIAVAICERGTVAPILIRANHIWSRSDVLEWLLNAMPQNTLAGFDLSPALPFADVGSYFPGWDECPHDAKALWTLVEHICVDDPHLAVSGFVDHSEASRYFRRHGGRSGDRFGSGRGRLRVVEHRQREHRLSPSSCFNLVGAAQVGKSSLTGMRMLHRLGGRLPVWPFDPMPESGSLLVEIYTSLAARAAGVPNGRSKLRDGMSLDAALARLNSEAHLPLTQYSDHATDALLTAAWLRTAADEPALWNPPGIDDVAATEGWTFGVR